MSKISYYFPHDYNAKDDERCSFLISKFGIAAYGLYWCFVEKMHQQADGKLTYALLDGLSQSFNTDLKLLNEFFDTAIEIGLFETDGTFYWSNRVLRNKEEFAEKRQQKSIAGQIGMAKRWGTNVKNNVVITDDNTVITKHNKVKESKVKENKESKVKDIELPAGIDKELWDGFIEMRIKVKKPPTDRAKGLLLKTLLELQRAGNDPNEVLRQSIQHNWVGLYELKGATNAKAGSNNTIRKPTEYTEPDDYFRQRSASR